MLNSTSLIGIFPGYLLIISLFLVGVLVGSIMTAAFKVEKSGKAAALACFIFQVFTIFGPMAFLVDGCNEVNLAGWQLPYSEKCVFIDKYMSLVLF